MENQKPTQGAWDNIQGYPKRIEFQLNQPVEITFSDDFERPLEMPQKDGNGVFYIFDCEIASVPEVKRCIQTSSWTLLQGLKTHEPLAGKKLEITKKMVSGKNKYFISDKTSKEVEDEEEMPDY